MQNKKSSRTLSTGSLVALGISLNSLCAYAVDQDISHTEMTESKTHNHSQMEEMACGARMRMDMTGMVMHENMDKLPKDCKKISEDITIVVKAGVKYSKDYPGTVFGYDQHQWQAKPCSRVTVELHNEDDIRHQWMIHGLPKYLYPQGMFHIELNGPGKKTGTFIVPSSHYTYLVHCDIAQHTEKGMKAQLKVGNGRGDLPSIPGISAPTFADLFDQK